jgi:hypothetical protein
VGELGGVEGLEAVVTHLDVMLDMRFHGREILRCRIVMIVMVVCLCRTSLS